MNEFLEKIKNKEYVIGKNKKRQKKVKKEIVGVLEQMKFDLLQDMREYNDENFVDGILDLEE